MQFIDTNYFLRLLIDDGSIQHKTATDFFLHVVSSDTTETHMSSTLVFFEVYWVLKSFYKLGKPQLAEAATSILKMDQIMFPDRAIILEAISYFAVNALELEDCYSLMVSRDAGCTDIATFDAKLSRAYKKLL